jgi:hypothetical protein
LLTVEIFAYHGRDAAQDPSGEEGAAEAGAEDRHFRSDVADEVGVFFFFCVA